MKDIMTKREVANYFSVSTTTVDNWVKRGLVKTKIGKLTRFTREAIIEFIGDRKA